MMTYKELLEYCLAFAFMVGVWEVIGPKFFYTRTELKLMQYRRILGPVMEIIIFTSIMIAYFWLT